eukprot:935265-Pleurochrysis_carterae.AAC.1
MNRGCALERVDHVCALLHLGMPGSSRDVRWKACMRLTPRLSVRTCLAHQILEHEQRTYQHKTHCSYSSGVAHTSATCSSSKLLRFYGRTA